MAAADAQPADAAEFRPDGAATASIGARSRSCPIRCRTTTTARSSRVRSKWWCSTMAGCARSLRPPLGGRLLELRDLVANRDLVFRNPVFQPANLAALNAWFSGGIEWNGLIPGHTPFTCAPVFAGLRETPRGADPQALRVRSDRRGDMADRPVPALGLVAPVRPCRIVNPSAEPRLAYWWTNIAAPMQPGTRVLSPADYSVEHIWPGNNLGRCDFPRQDWDASYPDHWENATLGVLPGAGGPAPVHRLGRSRRLWAGADQHRTDAG